MKHIFKQGSDSAKPVLLLLHGTGGTEESLLSLASMIDGEASVLSVRGNVLEQGMPRFFRRLGEGVFDEKDLIFRTKELHDFLDEASAQYGFRRDHIVAIGYSNGANVAASLLYHYDNALHGAILHHPMVPLRGITLPDLSGTHVLIAAGTNDPMIPQKEAEELYETLKTANASAEIHWENHGHQLTGSEAEAASQWYEQIYGVISTK